MSWRYINYIAFILNCFNARGISHSCRGIFRNFISPGREKYRRATEPVSYFPTKQIPNPLFTQHARLTTKDSKHTQVQINFLLSLFSRPPGRESTGIPFVARLALIFRVNRRALCVWLRQITKLTVSTRFVSNSRQTTPNFWTQLRQLLIFAKFR